MESYSELPLFKAPGYVLASDRTGKQSAYRSDHPQRDVQGWADSLNYAMDSYNASDRSMPYPRSGVQLLRNSDEFLDTLHNYLEEMFQTVLRTVPPQKARNESKAEAATRREALEKYRATLREHLHHLEAQRDIFTRALVYTKLQKLPGRAGGVELWDAGTPGKAVHDHAWELFEEYIAKTKAALAQSPFAEGHEQRRRRMLAIAAFALGGLSLIGLLAALALYLANRPPAVPQPMLLPPPPPKANPPHHPRQMAPPPQSPTPPPMGPQAAINPILLGYNPGIQEYLSIQTPFTPSPLYSYPA